MARLLQHAVPYFTPSAALWSNARRARLGALLTTSLMAAPLLAAESPLPVYPAGSAGARVEIMASCPTFSWSQVPSALAYEIVIYRIGRDDEDGKAEHELVLGTELPGGTAAWTPLAGDCLEADTLYAWAIRAALPEGRTEWSRASRFEIASPSAAEVARALEVLGNYLDRHRQDSNAGAMDGAAVAALRRAAPSGGNHSEVLSRPAELNDASHGRASHSRASESRVSESRTGRAATSANVGLRAVGGNVGVLAQGPQVGVEGDASRTSGTTRGVQGSSQSPDGVGVLGYAFGPAGASHGVRGTSASTQGIGVYGLAPEQTGSNRGVFGESRSANGIGVYGYAQSSTGSGIGIFGTTNSSTGFAGLFAGNVFVAGTLSKSSGSFKIDHPLDPANRYLAHSFVESPDMLNLYNGNAILDAEGATWVELPEWFEALNRSYRYQLTAIGRPAPSLFVSHEIAGNRFRIAGGEPGMRVSWQVTGVRDDAYARAHPIVVDEDKGPNRGFYLHPELFGQPSERAIYPGTVKSETALRTPGR